MKESKVRLFGSTVETRQLLHQQGKLKILGHFDKSPIQTIVLSLIQYKAHSVSSFICANRAGGGEQKTFDQVKVNLPTVWTHRALLRWEPSEDFGAQSHEKKRPFLCCHLVSPGVVNVFLCSFRIKASWLFLLFKLVPLSPANTSCASRLMWQFHLLRLHKTYNRWETSKVYFLFQIKEAVRDSGDVWLLSLIPKSTFQN